MNEPSSRQAAEASQPPVAPRRRTTQTVHGVELHDDYAWLRQRDEPSVRSYLEAENAYTDAFMAPSASLRQQLYEEMVGRLQETDSTVPTPRDDFFYYTRTVQGLQYPIYCRKRGSLESDEETLLDVNRLAEGKSYLRLGAFSISPCHRLLAYSWDEDGSETYRLRILDLNTEQLLSDQIDQAARGFAWANDSRSFFYTTLDAQRRPYRLHHHRLGEDSGDDLLLYEEADERFFLALYKTLSQRFLVIQLGSHTTSEVRYLDLDADWQTGGNADSEDATRRAADLADKFRLLAERQQDVEMSLEHRGESLYILSNEGAPNFRLLTTPVANPEPEHWREMIAHHEEQKLEGIDLFRQHLVVYLRRQGLSNIRVFSFEENSWHDIEFDEPAFAVWGQGNLQFDTQVLRFVYSSLVTPASTYAYDLTTRSRQLLKQVEVLGGYKPEDFECKRLHVASKDGTLVPVSLVHRRGMELNGEQPLLLYGYGSYGNSIDPYFSALRLSLLERGFSFAIAHVRGGGDFGRRWYDDGKLFKKRNTFDDFVAAAEALIEQGYTRADRLVMRGGSAGGMLIGTVINERPDLAAVAIAEVPFVDVVNTMLDPSLPLTVIEYEEWGNPQDPTAFEYIRSYSPYDNVKRQAFPHLLVTAGLNDPRVQYWEPAKWVAKLRTHHTGDEKILLRTNMDSGHGGASGRYDAFREEAFKQAFILTATKTPSATKTKAGHGARLG